jgi:molecular chaperone GrpE (heat shock protein)
MADQTAKALNLASRMVAASDQLMQAIEQLINPKDEKESSGVNFTAQEVEDALADSSLKHVDGNKLNGVLSSSVAIRDFMVTNFHDDVLQAVRP